MGTSILADNVENAARVGDTQVFAEHAEAVGEAEREKQKPPELNGWRMVRTQQGRRKLYKGGLCPESYVGPGGEAVQVLNAHQYASEGEHDWVVFGQKKEDVRAFLKACGLKARIRATDLIIQVN